MNPPRQIKRRGRAVISLVLASTLEEIALVGPERLTLEAVALRAGVNKTSIWRRWPTPEALALAALVSVSDAAPFTDTGSFRSDLLEYVTRFRDVCRTPAILSILRMKFRAELGDAIGSLLSERFSNADDEALIMFERAIERGDLPQGSDIRLLRDMLLSMINSFVLFRNDWFQGDNIEIVVDLFLGGALNATTNRSTS